MIGIVGPTATGKSDLGVEVALALGGEVVNADSMQLYRGMDVGTAKLTEPERRGVPHHVLDAWDVTQTASVAVYQRLARTAIDAILARGRVAVVVGGSGLYVRSAVDDLEFPGTDPAVRAALEAELAVVGAPALHARLAAADPVAAARILPGNGRRIVRALEVVEVTGRPFAAAMPPPHAVYDVALLGLDLPDDELDRRIERRVAQMWRRGLVAEVHRLLDAGLREGRTASRALGYAQVLRHVDGECTEEQARADTVRVTRRFARRQRSWFRGDPRVVWLPADSDPLRAALAAIATRAEAPGRADCG